MTVAIEIIARVVGVFIVAGTLWSAMLTVVVPRAERPRITRYHFKLMGVLSRAAHRFTKDPRRRDRFDARLAPFGLISLVFVWATHIIVGFALIYWGQGIRSFVDALVLSGSSFTTLGIRDADTLASLIIVVIEGIIGLGLVALMISYLPTVYSAYLDREIAVARLEVRAGRPPHPVTFLNRSNRIGWLAEMDHVWSEWENWFLQIDETHSTHTSLSFFRSAHYGRSWLQAAGVVLDSAALMQSTIDVAPAPRAALCIRSGFVALGTLADTFQIDRPKTPQNEDPISISRETFDELCDELRRCDIPLKADLDQAWRDFAGWRVNYDASLYGLFSYLRIEPGEWFGVGRATPPSDISLRS